MDNLLQNVTRNVCDNVRKKLGIENGEVPLIKRNKTLKNGDFQVPLNGLRKLLDKNTVGINGNASQLEEKLKEGSFGELICKNNLSDDKLFLFLRRSAVFQQEVCRILTSEGTWTQARTEQNVLLTAPYLGLREKSLSQLRTILLSQHIAKLLEVNGFNVKCDVSEDLESIVKSTGSKTPSESDKDHISELYEKLKNSEYYEESEDNLIIINYKELIKKKQLSQGKDQYDKSMEKSIVTADDEKLKILSSLRMVCQDFSKEESTCIHVTAANFDFTTQQVDLLWQIIGDAPKQQLHVSHGPVVTKPADGDSVPSAEEFLRLRGEETKQAFQMKYGDCVSGDKWTSIVKELSQAAIKFDLLSTSSKSSVKLDISHSADGEVENRAGVFVMYNYARLATLMQHFQEAVSNGTYGPLPDVAEVDFNLLKEKGEWELMFNYILPYPDLLQDCIADLTKNMVKPNIHTHKICQFLLDLSRDLSSYYCRVHVLGEGLTHLLPQMYARLSLLLAVKKLMEHGLQLLNISPISQL